ncbi:MAG: GNAT family N-acetyltransferase [Pyrinomonadaceae bacterium]|nr:GNAT family N-acetyltransferase [Pyrinomonadaceae bacterium]
MGEAIQHGMPGDVQIRQFELSDREALLKFLRIAYPDDARKSEPAYWDWHYVQNPQTDPRNIPLWVVTRGAKIVGQVATIPVKLKVGQEETPAIWILDFIVHEDYRGQGLGKRLMGEARAFCPTMIALGINEGSTAVLLKTGWKALGGVRRFQRLLFPGNDLKRASRIAAVRGLVNLCYSPFRPRLSGNEMERWTLREVGAFDSAFDVFWTEASAQWPCAVVRDARNLEWQFSRQPGKKFEALGLYEGERLMGYAVLFFRKSGEAGAPAKASIADLCYTADNATAIIDELLRAALRRALERRAGSLVTDVHDPRVEERLRRLGFWHIKRSPQFMAHATEGRERLMYDPANWFLTRGDSDVSIFEHPNV